MGWKKESVSDYLSVLHHGGFSFPQFILCVGCSSGGNAYVVLDAIDDVGLRACVTDKKRTNRASSMNRLEPLSTKNNGPCIGGTNLRFGGS